MERTDSADGDVADRSADEDVEVIDLEIDEIGEFAALAMCMQPE